jgi:hypothetical protein
VHDHVVEHGDTRTKPFVWRAVGAAPGQSAYAGPGRTAALYGYPPIKGVDPTQWVGDFLTASATYTNARRPMAGATADDPSLADLLTAYPTKWDGLVQLRMFLGAPGVPTLDNPYNAATIRVTGTRWTLVTGGHAGCDSGTAASSELVLPEVRALGTPAPNATTTGAGSRERAASGSPGRGAGTSGTARMPSASPGASSAGPAASGALPAASAAAARADDGSDGSDTVWLVVAVLAVLALGAAYVLRHRLTAAVRKR